MNNKTDDNIRFLPLSAALLLLMAGWGITLLLSLPVNALFSPKSYTMLAISLIFLELIFLVPALVYLRKKRPDLSVFKTFRLTKIEAKAWPGIIVFTGGVIILSDAADRILGKWIIIPEEYLIMMQNFKWSSSSEAVLMIFAATVIASIAEECIFRGMLLQAMESALKKPLAAILFSAFFFAMIHSLPWYFIQIFVLGVLLGGLSHLFHSALPGIFLHSMYNLFSLILLNINAEPSWYIIRGHVRNGWILTAGLLAIAGYYLSSPYFSFLKNENDKD